MLETASMLPARRRFLSFAPPQDFRGWANLTLLLASLWNSAFGIILLAFVAASAWQLRAVAGAGLLWLGVSTYRGFKRRHFPDYEPLAEGALIALTLWALGDIRLGLVLVYQGLFFHPVSRGRDIILLIASYAGAFLTVLAAQTLGGSNAMSLSELVTNLLACVVFGVVKFVLSHGSGVSQRAMVREQILAKAGAGLVAAATPKEVHTAALNAVRGVLAATGLTRVSLSLIDGESFEVVSSLGRDSEIVAGTRRLLSGLPERSRTYGRETRTLQVDAETADELEGALGFKPHAGTLTLTPLMIRNEFVGLLVVETPSPLPHEYKTGLTALCSEVALALQSARLTANLQRQAREDALTQLANRAAFVESLDRKLRETAETGSAVGVLFIDLDNFKIVNDSLGHTAGDLLLIEIARRLRSCAGENDLVARLGGDEFTVLLGDLGASAEPSLVAHKIRAALRQPVTIGERSITVSASIGIAVHDVADVKNASDLLQAADLALYAAKARGKAQAAVFEPAMAADAMQRLELEANLREALEREELTVHYQPLIDLQDGGLAEVEALVRWRHPVRGQISPAEFIPLAEETGLIVPLGRWVLNQACAQLRQWLTQFPSAPLVLAVNLSGKQLEDPHLVADVRYALQSNGLAPGRVKLEITESVAIADTPVICRVLQDLKNLGVQLAIDDFGSGNSALRYLQHFPIDTLKIDRSFVEGLGRDPRSAALLRGMVAFAKSIGLSVTGEGVETLDQSDCLRALGCDRAQGFLFARPAPPESITTLLDEHAEDRAA
jgi:diguanylate cyclase (GGDEF)-like protein